MSGAESVVTGFWRDHDLPKWQSFQYLVREETAQMIANAIAILFALTLPRLVVFAKLGLQSFRAQLPKWQALLVNLRTRISNSLLRPAQVTPNSTPSEPILMEPPRARMAAGASQTFAESSSFEDAAARIISRHLAMSRVELTQDDGRGGIARKRISIFRNFREDAWTFIWLSALAILLFAIFVGQQVIAISTASIISGSRALMTSPRCGVWISAPYIQPDLNVTKDDSKIWRTTSFPVDRALKAISYVDTCYGNDSRWEECSYYPSGRIPFKELHNASCPFNGDLCLFGSSGAYALDSGFHDSSLLGLNEASRCQFRIQSTCAPLVTTEPYVQSRPTGDEGTKVVDYFFGNANNYTWRNYPENLTFSQQYLAPNFNALIYKTKQYAFTEYPTYGLGRPRFRPELMIPNTSTSLFFIFSQNMLFTAPSHDPIFPAVRAPASSRGGGIYWNNLQRHTILACTETISFRHPASGALWFPWFSNASTLRSPDWQNPSVTNSVVLLNLTLNLPDYFPSKYSFKTALFDVHKKAAAVVASYPLAEEQWKVEARRMFEVRAARWQMDVIGSAAGVGSELTSARNLLEDYAGDEVKGSGLEVGVDLDVCRRIVFNANGWKNINVSGLTMLMLVAIGIWVSTIEVGKEVLSIYMVREMLLPRTKQIWNFAVRGGKLLNALAWDIRAVIERR